jgi:hypothetical protein
MNQEFDNLIIEWLQASHNLEIAKEKEMELRIKIVPAVLREFRLEGFTKTLQLGKGYKLRATNTVNYKLEEVEKVVEVIDKIVEIGCAHIAKDLFKWKPSLSETHYKQLPYEVKEIVDEILTIKPGAPQLKFLKPGDDD